MVAHIVTRCPHTPATTPVSGTPGERSAGVKAATRPPPLRSGPAGDVRAAEVVPLRVFSLENTLFSGWG